MNNKIHIAVVLALAAAGFAAGAAQAQTYGAPYGQQPPLYPYAVQQPYAVQVSPGVYVIQRPAAVTAPHVGCVHCRTKSKTRLAEPGAGSDQPRKSADRALIEELRQHAQPKRDIVTTTKIVREPPIVRETTRVVDDPPRVIERRHIVEDLPPEAPGKRRPPAATEGDVNAASPDDGKQRVIRAEAEVTILGPDRMSIRLFRKRRGADAKAQSED